VLLCPAGDDIQHAAVIDAGHQRDAVASFAEVLLVDADVRDVDALFVKNKFQVDHLPVLIATQQQTVMIGKVVHPHRPPTENQKNQPQNHSAMTNPSTKS